MRKLIVGVAVALLAVGNVVGAAPDLNRRRPPQVSVLYKGEVVQRARPYTYCWSRSFPDGSGVATCADGVPRYPRAARVKAPARLVLRIGYPAKPRNWYLDAYRLIIRHDYGDETVGPAEAVAFKLKPHRVRGRVKAWDLVFRVTERSRHYYLDTGGYLKQGDAFYSLHLRT